MITLEFEAYEEGQRAHIRNSRSEQFYEDSSNETSILSGFVEVLSQSFFNQEQHKMLAKAIANSYQHHFLCPVTLLEPQL